MLLVVTYSRAARRTLRNVCSAHEESVVRQFGRAALFEWTELAAFHALRMREKHGLDVEIDRVERFEPASVPAAVREAATAYERRETPSLPYRQFAAGSDHPDPASMAGEPLE